MASTQLKTVIPGVQMRLGKEGRTIRFACMVRGTRFAEMYTGVPVELLVDTKGRGTRQLKDAYNAWKTKCEEKVGVTGKYGMREPTLGELIGSWEKFALERSADPRYLQPKESTISNAVTNFKACMAEAGLKDSDNCRALLNDKTLKEVFDSLIRRGLAGVSAWTYIMSVQTITSPWTKDYYERLGFLVPKPKMPDAGLVKDPPRYKRPSKEIMEKQDMFYAKLQDLDDKKPFLAVSMALHLAMRDEDIGLLTSENFFRGQDGRMYLSYMPQKTKLSSKRTVTWPIPDALWEQIREYAGERLDAGKTMISSIRYVVEQKINPAMRLFCGMESHAKAFYEYRKRCIDYVYHHFGLNAAVAISGDSASTIEYYYYDPAMDTMAPSFETVPIRPAKRIEVETDSK